MIHPVIKVIAHRLTPETVGRVSSETAREARPRAVPNLLSHLTCDSPYIGRIEFGSLRQLPGDRRNFQEGV